MAKAKLIFDLTDPDDRMEHRRCVKSLDMAAVLWEISYNLRKNYQEYREPKESDTYNTAVDEIFEDIHDLLSGNSIDIDDLIY